MCCLQELSKFSFPGFVVLVMCAYEAVCQGAGAKLKR